MIAGPTGSGETTITNEIVRLYPARVGRLVTATTRSPRLGERQGVDYYFLNKADFLAKQVSGEILEVTYVPNRDAYYGSYASDLEEKLAAGYIVIVNTDIVGAKFYKERYSATTIFIMPGSMSELKDRLRKRNPEMSEEELAKRIADAEREVREERPFYDHTVVNVGGGLARSVSEVTSILEQEGYDVTSLSHLSA